MALIVAKNVLMKNAASLRFWNSFVLSGFKHFKLQGFCRNDSNKDGGGSTEAAAPCGSIIRLHCSENSGDLNPDCVLSACATALSAGCLYGSDFSEMF